MHHLSIFFFFKDDPYFWKVLAVAQPPTVKNHSFSTESHMVPTVLHAQIAIITGKQLELQDLASLANVVGVRM